MILKLSGLKYTKRSLPHSFTAYTYSGSAFQKMAACTLCKFIIRDINQSAQIL